MSPLDNPIWNSLCTNHRDRSLGTDLAKRYRPDIAPFVAVATVTPESAASLFELVQPGETVCILNVAPEFGEGWSIEKEITIVQMTWHGDRHQADDGGDVVALTDADVPAMLELTQLVYPAYFRQGTAELGTYFGVFEGDRLCSMAGIRMSMPGYQEISAVCTHPDYRGRGLARRLMNHLIHYIRQREDQVFLHTEDYNTAARAMYEGMGFGARAELPFWIATRI